MDNRFYSYIGDDIKINAFNVMDYFNVNRKQFIGLHFSQAFGKLMDECTFLGLPEEDLAKAVDTALTIEQRRIESINPGGHYHVF